MASSRTYLRGIHGRIVVRALWYLAIYDLVEVFWKDQGPRRMLRKDPLRTDVPSADRDAIVRAVQIACALYVRPATCFHRSTVLSLLLRRSGVPATVVVGYRTPPFESHAWVEVDDLVVGDRQSYRRHFHIIDRLPSSSPSSSLVTL